MSAQRLILRAVLAVLAIAAVGGGVCLYLGISTSLHAENTLHAILNTMEEVERFVAAERRWPRSWSELAPYAEEFSHDAEAWRVESQTRQTYMQIDFDCDLNDVASQTPEQFRAIYPTGAVYPYEHYWILDELLDTAKRIAASNSIEEPVTRTHADGAQLGTLSQSAEFSNAIDQLRADNDLDTAVAARDKLVAAGKEAFPALLNHLDDDSDSHIEFQGAVEPYVPPPIGQVCFSILQLQIEGRWPKSFRHHRVLNRVNISRWIEERPSKSLSEMRTEALTQAIQELEQQVDTDVRPEHTTMVREFLRKQISLVDEPEFIRDKPFTNPFD